MPYMREVLSLINLKKEFGREMGVLRTPIFDYLLITGSEKRN